jgi:EpsI family protein
MQPHLLRALVLAASMVSLSVLAAVMTPRTFLADQQRHAALATVVPSAFGVWAVDRSVVPVPPSPDLQRVIDETYDETLSATYRDDKGNRVMLSVAYGRNQHKGMNTHRPEVCYPAQGFRIESAAERGVLRAAGREIPVTRLVARMDARVEPITYWLVVGDRITEFGYPQRAQAIRYGLRGIVPDGMLFRVSSISGDAAQAYEIQQRFVEEMMRSLPAPAQARLLGAS